MQIKREICKEHQKMLEDLHGQFKLIMRIVQESFPYENPRVALEMRPECALLRDHYDMVSRSVCTLLFQCPVCQTIKVTFDGQDSRWINWDVTPPPPTESGYEHCRCTIPNVNLDDLKL